MYFPNHRPRRLRQNENFRRLIRETTLTVNDLIYPMFVVSGKRIKEEVVSMPGVLHLSVDMLVKEAAEVAQLGIPAIIIFGIPEQKSANGADAYKDDGPVQLAIAALKKDLPELLVITDVCLCAYTDHGHCGLVGKDGEVLNDDSLPILASIALSHARAGADMVAPSDMMDGRIAAIRAELDKAGFKETPIMSYAAKYASAFYGPFREAAGSAPAFGDRKTYQMDVANVDEALREAALDIEEGADILMVKPALAYLDVISKVKESFGYPTAAYNVSGEYAMIKAAAANGWVDEKLVVLEMLTSIKRAGADMILTYHAKDVAKWLG
ncbi:MAG: porphobilinogen synthase [Actinomycetota bacterium]|nr:porphobilinogen synthase [Actinomycetota bacterium]